MTTTQQPAMHTPPVVSSDAWEAARQRMLVKEKAPDACPDALGRGTAADALDGRREGV